LVVHRSQAATVDTAHRYEDGGGRELAYVAMSRARESSHVYVVADDLDQAVEDLVPDWSMERRIRWAIDTGTPSPDLAPERAPHAIPPDAVIRLARLRAERHAVAAAIPPEPRPLLRRLESQLAELRQAKRNLEPGWVHYPSTPEGEAARAVTEARSKRRQAEQFARMDGMDWRSRRYWRRSARKWAEEEVAAQERYDRVAGPELERLSREVDRLEARHSELANQFEVREDWLSSHPEAARRIQQLDRELARAERRAAAPSVADGLTDLLGRQGPPAGHAAARSRTRRRNRLRAMRLVKGAISKHRRRGGWGRTPVDGASLPLLVRRRARAARVLKGRPTLCV
jgi:hypothetical protein